MLYDYTRQCFYCGSSFTVKNGFRRGKQCYKCQSCGRQFVIGFRIDDELLVRDYIEGRQTLVQLAAKYGVDKSTIWRHLRSMRHIRVIPRYKSVIVNMDTTYWERNFGLMVIKDSFRNRIIWYKFVRHETVSDYLEGIRWLDAHGFTIHAIVCDGMRGQFHSLSCYPVQMCQFHQVMIVRRYLTGSPELPASQELLGMARSMFHTDRNAFIGELETWYGRWENFLRERTVGRDGRRTTYTHRRLRSVYLSLKRNMPWLWTFYDNPQLHIPNTNNAQEGVFTDIKIKLRVHSGISKERRKTIIQEYIARHY